MSVNPTQQALVVPWQGPQINDSNIKQYFYVNFIASFPLERLTKICVVGLAVGTLALGVIILLAVHQKIGGCNALSSLGDSVGGEVMAMGGVILLGVIGCCREIVSRQRQIVQRLATTRDTFKLFESVFEYMDTQRTVCFPKLGKFLFWENEKQNLGYLFVIQGRQRGVWLYYDHSEDNAIEEDSITKLSDIVAPEIVRLMDGKLGMIMTMPLSVNSSGPIWPKFHDELGFFEEREEIRTLLNESPRGIIALYSS